jgi:hypothetical protein
MIEIETKIFSNARRKKRIPKVLEHRPPPVLLFMHKKWSAHYVCRSEGFKADMIEIFFRQKKKQREFFQRGIFHDRYQRARSKLWPDLGMDTRVARWFVFKPKILLWVNFGGPLNGKCWYIL